MGRLTVLWLALGCGGGECPPLAETDLRGDWVAEDRALIRAALASFDDHLAVPVCVSHIRYKHDARYLGRYNRVTRGIRLVGRPTTHEDFQGRLRHEVCHAIDTQNGLVPSDRALWAGEPNTRVPWWATPEREVFALFCDATTPAAWAALAPEDCDEAGAFDARHAVLRDVAFGGPRVSAPLSFGPPRPITGLSEGDHAFTDCAVVSDRLRIDAVQAAVDPSAVARCEPARLPEGWADVNGGSLWLADGRHLVFGEAPAELGAQRRLLVWDGDDLLGTAHCVARHSALIEAGGRGWLVELGATPTVREVLGVAR